MNNGSWQINLVTNAPVHQLNYTKQGYDLNNHPLMQKPVCGTSIAHP